MAADVTNRDKTTRPAAVPAQTTTKVPVPFVVVLGHGRREKRITVHARSPYLYSDHHERSHRPQNAISAAITDVCPDKTCQNKPVPIW